jgi:hypothetical protein
MELSEQRSPSTSARETEEIPVPFTKLETIHKKEMVKEGDPYEIR